MAGAIEHANLDRFGGPPGVDVVQRIEQPQISLIDDQLLSGIVRVDLEDLVALGKNEASPAWTIG